MGAWDSEFETVPTFAHEIVSALEEREVPVVESERAEGRSPPEDVRTVANVVRAAEDGTVAEEAELRVRERHGPPGPGLTVRPKIIRDLPARIVSRIAVRDGRVLIFGGGSTIKAECPSCPRHEQSWTLVDIRDVVDPVRSAIKSADYGQMNPTGRLPPYACNGCWTRWERDGLFLHSEWIEAHGGPPELVRETQVKERVLELRREANAAGERFDPQAARTQAESEIPTVGGS